MTKEKSEEIKLDYKEFGKASALRTNAVWSSISGSNGKNRTYLRQI